MYCSGLLCVQYINWGFCGLVVSSPSSFCGYKLFFTHSGRGYGSQLSFMYGCLKQIYYCFVWVLVDKQLSYIHCTGVLILSQACCLCFWLSVPLFDICLQGTQAPFRCINMCHIWSWTVKCTLKWPSWCSRPAKLCHASCRVNVHI